MTDYCENILRSITMVTNDAVSKASFDKTILTTVISCEDEATGKYKVKYQDSVWIAYDSNMNVTYSQGTNVYVLIPGGDMSNQKTIVGAASNFGIDYLDYVNNETKFLQNGNSITTLSDEQGICSYRGSDQLVLYDVTNNNLDLLEIDDAAAAEYLQSSDYIMLKADFQTNLADSQRNQGSYGLKVDIVFQNTQNQEEDITRTYVLDIDDMVGNPYLFTVPLTQEEIYELDGKHFKYISSISFYCENFNTGSSRTDDIFISNVELYGMNALTTQELQGASLRFKRLQGYIFNSTSGNPNEDTRDVIAQLRIKGRYMTPAGNKISFYWFKQDSHIDSASRYYSKYGGKGWKCLNDIQEDLETGDIKILAAGDTLTIKRSDIVIQRVRYKCVAVYNGTEISNTFEMINLHSQYEIEIISDDPKKELTFYSNEDSLLLKCVVKYNGSVITQNLNYYWRKVSEHGTSENLSPYTDDQQTPVTHNDMTMAQAFQVVSYSDYYCSVYKTVTGGQQEIGTVSVRIFKKTQDTSRYILTIKDGTQLFNYDEAGNSPFIQELNETHQTIPVLTFTVIDTYTEQDVTELVDEYIWTIPLKDTMLVDKNVIEVAVPTEEQDPDYRQYKNLTPFIYGIRERYASDKSNNDITLKVSIHNIEMTETTSLLFTKEGQLGTNGTGIVCKIRPKKNNRNVSGWLYVRINRSIESSGPDNPVANWDTLNVELWQNGEIINTNNQQLSIKWQMLSLGDNSWYKIDDPSSGSISLANSSLMPKASCFTMPADEEDSSFQTNKGFPANLIKLTVVYNGRNYYDVIPIATIYTIGIPQNTFKISLSDGFKYVTYSQDGQNPKYDDALPFTISLASNLYNLANIQWRVVGSVNRGTKFAPINPVNLKVNTNTTKNNEIRVEENKYKKYYDAATIYDGSCVTNAIIAYDSTQNIYIHIPIHFMLNRYGHKNLNDWDGNSIKIDTEDNYILSPQIGAGVKNTTTNTFTGLLMGIVDSRYINSTTQSLDFKRQIGLFGYNEGQRTIFLDSQTGKAEFGKDNNGKIIINPTESQAYIYGGNYSESGQGSGMRINLSNPQIKFGSGNFLVTSNGTLTAKRGFFGPWGLINTALYYNNGTSISDDNVILGNSNSNKDYLYLGVQGFSLGKSFIYDLENETLNIKANSISIGGTDMADAAKTATNYLYYRSSNPPGLYISKEPLTDNNFGNRTNMNIRLTDSGMEICNGTETLVKYGTQTVFYGGYHQEGGIEVHDEAAVLDQYGLYISKGKIILGTDFEVKPSGQLIAKAGKIGGVNISAGASTGHIFENSLYIQSTGYDQSQQQTFNYQAGISGESSSSTDLVFYVKRKRNNMDSWNINNDDVFFVRKNGQLFANKAKITGEITATSLKLSGSLIVGTLEYYQDQAGTIKSGFFLDSNGHLRIGKSSSSSPHLLWDGSNLTITGDITASTLTLSQGLTVGFIGPNTYGCQITQAGQLKASNADIAGNIHATSGIIDSDVTINGTLSAANIQADTIGGFYVSWQLTKIIYDISCVWTRETINYTSNFRQDLDGTFHWDNSSFSFDRLSEMKWWYRNLYLLVNEGSGSQGSDSPT